MQPLPSKVRPLFFILSFFLSSISLAEEGLTTRVYDGDTLVLGGHSIRLLGINTPEMNWKKGPPSCYAQEAKDYLTQRVLHKKIILKADPEANQRDKYGRLLRYVYLDGELMNQTLIEQGYARAYTRFPFSKKTEFLRTQRKAKKEKAGLWGQCLKKI